MQRLLFLFSPTADGMTYSFGLFYDEFLLYFNEGKGYTAWIVSIMVGVTFASGELNIQFMREKNIAIISAANFIFLSFKT